VVTTRTTARRSGRWEPKPTTYAPHFTLFKYLRLQLISLLGLSHTDDRHLLQVRRDTQRRPEGCVRRRAESSLPSAFADFARSLLTFFCSAAASTTFLTTKTTINDASVASVLVLSKYPLLSLLTNRGSSGSNLAMTITTTYPAGSTVVDVIACAKVTVSSAKKITVTVTKGAPKVRLCFLSSSDF
jgi:hypothetical protein